MRYLLTVFLLFSGFIMAKDYSAVDKHAISVKNSDGLLQLTATLTKPYDGEKDKCRAIFTWIAHNIAYDYEAFLQGSYSALKPEDVLARRRAVCGGYANLFKEMAETAGLQAVVVGGFSKGYGYDAQYLFADRNRHAWNAILINGDWQLLDVTWGAGYIDDGKFKASFNDFYFHTPPEQLIQTHYPERARWQLLNKPRTRTNFSEMPLTRPAFFKYDMRMLSHTEREINAGNSLQIRLSGSPDVVLLSRLYVGESEMDDMLSFAQRSEDGFIIRAYFPQPAEYTLRIFARRKTDQGKYNWLMDYTVRAEKGYRGTAGFPEKLGSFDDFNSRLYSPMQRFLTVGDSVFFRISVEDADKVALIHEDTFTHLQRNGDFFEGKFEVPPADFFIGARFPNTNQYMFLLRYEGW